jgi:hypothetical protein
VFQVVSNSFSYVVYEQSTFNTNNKTLVQLLVCFLMYNLFCYKKYWQFHFFNLRNSIICLLASSLIANCLALSSTCFSFWNNRIRIYLNHSHTQNTHVTVYKTYHWSRNYFPPSIWTQNLNELLLACPRIWWFSICDFGYPWFTPSPTKNLKIKEINGA